MGDGNGSDSALDGDSFGDYGGILVSQQGSMASGPASVKEFPVNLKQNIIAGGTPVGMKVQAKLTVATFVMGLCSKEYDFFWTGYRVDRAVCGQSVEDWNLHGVGAMEWFGSAQAVPDGLVLSDDRSARSGSFLRSAAIPHEDLEWSRDISRPELAGIATVSQRGHECSGFGGTRGPGLFAIQATGLNERCFAGAKQ